MTTLQKLDVVAFWTARAFACLLIGFIVWSNWIVVSAILQSWHLIHHWHAIFTNLAVTQVMLLVFILLVCLSLRFSQTAVARVFLFLTGCYFFLGGFLSALTWEGIGWKLSLCTAAVGFASLMWAAIRPADRLTLNF